MHTPAHIIVNVALLGTRDRARLWWAAALGGLLPDLPMWIFYGLERARGVAEAAIWTERYFDPGWQVCFDLPNSLPLTVAGALFARLRGWLAASVCLLSMAFHSFCDLWLHHDDAHRHFFPYWDFRFESPVSYWDPTHHGTVAGAVELIVTLGLGLALLRLHPERPARRLVASLLLVHLGFLAYARAVWASVL